MLRQKRHRRLSQSTASTTATTVTRTAAAGVAAAFAVIAAAAAAAVGTACGRVLHPHPRPHPNTRWRRHPSTAVAVTVTSNEHIGALDVNCRRCRWCTLFYRQALSARHGQERSCFREWLILRCRCRRRCSPTRGGRTVCASTSGVASRPRSPSDADDGPAKTVARSAAQLVADVGVRAVPATKTTIDSTIKHIHRAKVVKTIGTYVPINDQTYPPGQSCQRRLVEAISCQRRCQGG